VGWTARAEEASMALEIKIKFRWVGDASISNGSSRTVTTSIRLFFWE
jgi:hypothetical protein